MSWFSVICTGLIGLILTGFGLSEYHAGGGMVWIHIGLLWLCITIMNIDIRLIKNRP
jgi:hypothetical protein